MNRVVSVTQNAIQRDSRAYKVAASLTRFGYESVVFEAEPSSFDRKELPFELFTVGEASPAPAPEPGDPQDASGAGGEGSRTERTRPVGLLATLFARLPDGLQTRLGPLASWALERTVRALEPAYVLTAMARNNLRLLCTLPPADLYYMHHFAHFPAAWLLGKRHRARLLYDAHDANFEPDPALLASFRNQRTMRMLESIDRAFARRADAFLTVGDGVAALLERSYGRRPQVVRNYHDFRMDRESPLDVRSAAGLGEDDFLLVMTGATKPGDTVEEGLAALALLPAQVHLALVGKGHQQHGDLISHHGLEGRVHAIEPVPPTEVAGYIRTADASPILYRPLSENYRQALPNRFSHAVAAGLPILYPTSLPEIASRCERFEMGLPIEPAEPYSIAGAVERLLGDPGLRERLRVNVRSAHDELSWEHEEAVLAPLVGGLVKRSGGA